MMIKSKRRNLFNIASQMNIREVSSRTFSIQIMEIFWFRSLPLQKYDTIILIMKREYIIDSSKRIGHGT